MNYLKVIVATAALSALAMSCTDTEYFDKEEYDKLVAKTFPVTDVDPDQDWQTVATANVSVKLMQSGEGNSTVRIYDDDPSSDDAHMLAKASLANGETMYANINYLLASPYVYITVTDAEGYNSLYVRKISNYSLSTVVGDAQTTQNQAPRKLTGVSYQFAKDYKDGDYPTSVPADALNFEGEYDKDATTNFYVQGTSEKKKVGNFNKEGATVYLTEGNYTIENLNMGSGATLILMRGANVSVTVSNDYYANDTTKKLVVCEGATLSFENNITMYGFAIYNHGRITSDQILLGGGSIFYNGGVCILKGDLKIDESASTALSSSQHICAGTESIGGTLIVGGAFKNMGEFVCRNATLKFTNSSESMNAWVNDGYFKVKKEGGNGGSFDIANNSKGSGQVVTGCNMEVGKTLSLNNSNITFKIDGGYVSVSNNTVLENAKIEMAANSILHCKKQVKLNNSTISGPNEGTALIWTGMFNGGTSASSSITGNVRIACTKNNNLENVTYTENSGSSDDGTKVAFQGYNNAKVCIAPTACMSGYNGKPDVDAVYPEKPASLRYCYEDMFPSPGDYDFNDVVLDITPEKVADNKVKYSICLVAVGATKQLAGALRLKGISASQISNVEVSSSGYFDYGKTTTANTDMFGKQTSSGEASSSYFSSGVLDTGLDGNAVIYLFNDAHYSMYGANDDALAKDGSVKRMMINTVAAGDKTYQKYAYYITPPTTYTVTVTFTDDNASTNVETARTTDCLDPFLIESYNGVNWEVHEVSKKTDAVLFSYGSTTNENYSNNYPWGICVPGTFKYPIEGTPIGSYSSNVLSGAYQTGGHSFGEWAKNRDAAEDWYKYPTSSLVYE